MSMDDTRTAMDGPVDLHVHSLPIAQLFSVAEANAMIPRLETIFRSLDPKLARLRDFQELIEDAEGYWGDGLLSAPTKDREAYARAMKEVSDLERTVQTEIDEIRSFGCEVKDVHRGLVDFPARIGRDVAYLCWQRGEGRVAWWHTLEAGFAGRTALTPEAER